MGRSDFSAHQFGINLVGVVEWRPVSSLASFIVRNTRYYYDNQTFENSFDSAMQLEGVKGNGEALTVPLDTRGKSAVLEVANVTGDQISVSVNIYDATGSIVDTRTIQLEGYGSQHIVADAILNGGVGLAKVNGSTAGSVLAVGMHYGRTDTNGIKFVYGILGKQALGTTLKSSYNSFLGQGCELIIANSSSTATEATVNMVRLDGTEILDAHVIEVPGNGSAVYDICANDSVDQYGVVTVEASTANRLLSTIIRLGANDDYRFPTPIR